LKPALTSSAQPPQRTACSPNRVGLGLLAEGRLEHAGAGAADAAAVGQRELLGVAGGVLVDGDEAGDAAALLEDLAHAVAGGLRRDHGDVDVLRRDDALEADVEAVGEHQHLAGGEVRGDLGLVEAGLHVVGHEHHDDVGPGADVVDAESTVRPAFLALAADLLVGARPTRTLTPLSFRLSAWAWPWEP
jgi:hypothetical protein